MHDRNNIEKTTAGYDNNAEINVNCLRCKYIIEQKKKSQNKAISNIEGLFYVCNRCREKAQHDIKTCRECYDNVCDTTKSFIGSQVHTFQHKRLDKIEKTRLLKTDEIQQNTTQREQHRKRDEIDTVIFLKSKVSEQNAEAKSPEYKKMQSPNSEYEKIMSTTNLKPLTRELAIDQMFGPKRLFTEITTKESRGFDIRFAKEKPELSKRQVSHNIYGTNTYLTDSVETLDMINLETSASKIDSLRQSSEKFEKLLIPSIYTGHKKREAESENLKFKEPSLKSFDSHTQDTYKSSLKNIFIKDSYPDDFIVKKVNDIQKEIIKSRHIKSDDDLLKDSISIQQQRKKICSLRSYSSTTLLSQKPSEFSFHFLQKYEDKNSLLCIKKSSSELIVEVRDLLRVKAEIKKEKQNQKKIEELERKRIVQENKIQKLRDKVEVTKSKNMEEEDESAKSTKSKVSRTRYESETDKELLGLEKAPQKVTGNKKKEEIMVHEKIEKRKSPEEITVIKKKEDEKRNMEEKTGMRMQTEKVLRKKEKDEEVAIFKTLKETEKSPKQNATEFKPKQTRSNEESAQLESKNKTKQLQEKEETTQPLLVVKEKNIQPNQEDKAEQQREKEDKQPQQKVDLRKSDDILIKDMLKKVTEHTKSTKDTKSMKTKKEQEEKEKQSKEDAEGNKKQDGKMKRKSKESKKEPKRTEEPELIKSEPNKLEKPTTSELKMNKTPRTITSRDNLILQLLKVRSSNPDKVRKKSEKIGPQRVKVHKRHSVKTSSCVVKVLSDLDIDFEESKKKVKELAEIIIGEKIFKYKPPLAEKFPVEGEKIVPILFQTVAPGVELAQQNKITPADGTEKDVQRKMPLLEGKNLVKFEMGTVGCLSVRTVQSADDFARSLDTLLKVPDRSK